MHKNNAYLRVTHTFTYSFEKFILDHYRKPEINKFTMSTPVTTMDASF